MLAPNNGDDNFMQTADSTVIMDPLFGTPTGSARNISKDKRFLAFASRLGSTEYGDKLNTNKLINLFLYIEWQCLHKSILQMRSRRQGVGNFNLVDFHIEVVRHPASVRSEDNLLELTLSCIGGSPIKAKVQHYKDTRESFLIVEKSYILHHATHVKSRSCCQGKDWNCFAVRSHFYGCEQSLCLLRVCFCISTTVREAIFGKRWIAKRTYNNLLGFNFDASNILLLLLTT